MYYGYEASFAKFKFSKQINLDEFSGYTEQGSNLKGEALLFSTWLGFTQDKVALFKFGLTLGIVNLRGNFVTEDGITIPVQEKKRFTTGIFGGLMLFYPEVNFEAGYFGDTFVFFDFSVPRGDWKPSTGQIERLELVSSELTIGVILNF